MVFSVHYYYVYDLWLGVLWIIDKCPDYWGMHILLDYCLQGIHHKGSYRCYSFCKELKASDNIALLAPYVDHMAQGLVTMATQSTDEVLTYTLESLIMLLKVSIIRNIVMFTVEALDNYWY